MHAKIFVFNHHAACLRQDPRDKNGLILVLGRNSEPLPQFLFFSVLGNCKATNRTDVNTSIAFDAEFLIEDGLYVAVETALNLNRRLLTGKPKLDFDIQLIEPFLQVNMSHLTPL